MENQVKVTSEFAHNQQRKRPVLHYIKDFTANKDENNKNYDHSYDSS